MTAYRDQLQRQFFERVGQGVGIAILPLVGKCQVKVLDGKAVLLPDSGGVITREWFAFCRWCRTNQHKAYIGSVTQTNAKPRKREMPKLERTQNGYAVEGRDTFIFKVLKTWCVTFRTWSGARETREFKTLAEAKKFALGQDRIASR